MSQTNKKMRAIAKAKKEDQDRRIEAAVEEARKNPKKRDHKRNLVIFLVIALVLCLVAGVKFLNDSSPADDDAVAAATVTEGTTTETGVTVTDLGNGKLCFAPDEKTAAAHEDLATTAFTFYPGGQVERDSYAVLAQKLAKQGITVILEEVPFDLAIFEPNSAEGNIDLLPNIKYWYIGGHSLGGLCAGTYLSTHDDPYLGLILLGSYVNDNISDKDIAVLSIYGTEDNVIELDKYEENKALLPKDFTEYIIEGGNHGQFGNYGTQRGDHDATITRDEQQDQTVKYIVEFMEKNNK